jgi:hypothetical protein
MSWWRCSMLEWTERPKGRSVFVDGTHLLLNKMRNSKTCYHILMTYRFRVIFIILVLVIISFIGIWYATVGRYGFFNGVAAERFEQAGIANSDPSVCAKVWLVFGGIGPTTADERASCYQNYVRAHPQENICPTNDDDRFHTAQDTCLIEYAAENDDPSVCLMMPYPAPILNCVAVVAERNRNELACNVLATSTDAQRCRTDYEGVYRGSAPTQTAASASVNSSQ